MGINVSAGAVEFDTECGEWAWNVAKIGLREASSVAGINVSVEAVEFGTMRGEWARNVAKIGLREASGVAGINVLAGTKK